MRTDFKQQSWKDAIWYRDLVAKKCHKKHRMRLFLDRNGDYIVKGAKIASVSILFIVLLFVS
jgi:hypothetical protein